MRFKVVDKKADAVLSLDVHVYPGGAYYSTPYGKRYLWTGGTAKVTGKLKVEGFPLWEGKHRLSKSAIAERSLGSKMIRMTIVLCIALVSGRVGAQAKTWHRTFGGTDAERAHAMYPTSDGGYILAGFTESYGAGSSDMWLVKTDADGQKQWDRKDA